MRIRTTGETYQGRRVPGGGQDRGQQPVGSTPGRPMRQARPSLPPVWGQQSLSPAA